MRLLLINPWEGEVFPPPSIGYLQAVAKDYCEVKALDLTNALKDLKTNTYDIVGVSFHSFSVKFARQIRNAVKGHLICGGHHPSALPEQMLSIGCDQVIIGEGESALIEVIKGNRDKIIHGKPLDKIPFPDYTGLIYSGAMGLPIISSRGCPFKCNFCASAEFWGRKWRGREPSDVIAEIKSSEVKTFMFEDDNFTLKKDRAIEICKGLKGYIWQCATRADVLQDKEFCQVLYDSGCRVAWLGIESLSQGSLDRAKKGIKVENILKGIEVAESVGIQTMSQFIVGLPDDTEKDINKTVKNIKRSAIKRKGTNIAWVLPNTEIYRKAKEKGFDESYYLDHGAPFYTLEQSMETLNVWSNKINQA